MKKKTIKLIVGIILMLISFIAAGGAVYYLSITGEIDIKFSLLDNETNTSLNYTPTESFNYTQWKIDNNYTAPPDFMDTYKGPIQNCYVMDFKEHYIWYDIDGNIVAESDNPNVTVWSGSLTVIQTCPDDKYSCGKDGLTYTSGCKACMFNDYYYEGKCI